MPDASTEEMYSVNDYLYWAYRANLDLKFELTPDDLQNIMKAKDHKIW